MTGRTTTATTALPSPGRRPRIVLAAKVVVATLLLAILASSNLGSVYLFGDDGDGSTTTGAETGTWGAAWGGAWERISEGSVQGGTGALLALSPLPLRGPSEPLARGQTGEEGPRGEERGEERLAGSEFRSTSDGSFPGAREWRDEWIRASSRRRGAVAGTGTSSHNATSAHAEEMHRRYEDAGALPDYYARGLGWIRDRLDLVLTVVVAGEGGVRSRSLGDVGDVAVARPGPLSVFVVDTIGKMRCGDDGGGRGDAWIDRHPPLTMWVRAEGPEIFAGTASPHRMEASDPALRRRCAWRYDFDPRLGGKYRVHVKLLTFDGFADFSKEECRTEKIPPRGEGFDKQKKGFYNGSLEELEAENARVVEELAASGNFRHHRGVNGFKMYDPSDACCEACTRTRNCRMWSIPGGRHFDECELYFDRVEDDVDFLHREDGRYLGRERNYSYTAQRPDEFPQIRKRRRRLSSSRRKLAVSTEEIGKIWPIGERPSTGYPRSGRAAYFLGCGWSSLMSFENPCHYPSDDLVFGSGIEVSVASPDATESAPAEPRPCSLDDERLDVSDGRWVRRPYPDNETCTPLVQDPAYAAFRTFRPEYRGDRDPRCWHRDDLTQVATTCAEPGCRWVIDHRWTTRLKRESRWYGMWESRECAYRDMGDDAIQNCVESKNIASVKVEGMSIANIVKGYLDQKLRNITFPKEGTLNVTLNTLKISHVIWHHPIDEYRETLEKDFVDVSANDAEEHYWITGFYFTSEREPHVLVDRSLQFSKMAWDVLTPKGYKMINALDVTSAFAFDTDGQADGLHIGGPPIRAVVTKFFHHLCHDVGSVSGDAVERS